MKQKRWSDLTSAQRIGVMLLGTLQLLLLFASLWDIRQRSADEVNGSKQVWTAAVFVNFIGPIAYFLFGRKR